jgi:hypothetical protein
VTMIGMLAIAYAAFAIITGLTFVVVGLPYLLDPSSQPGRKTRGWTRVVFGLSCLAASALGWFIPDAVRAVQTAHVDIWSIVQLVCVAIMLVCIVINLVLLSQRRGR